MSKGSKTFVFKTERGEKLTLTHGSQEDAVKRLGELVSSVKDWPYVRVFKVKG